MIALLFIYYTRGLEFFSAEAFIGLNPCSHLHLKKCSLSANFNQYQLFLNETAYYREIRKAFLCLAFFPSQYENAASVEAMGDYDRSLHK